MTRLEDITELTISNFRSIVGTQTVPLDAPIVLIHGANGAGKTSILSALELTLTGNILSMQNDDPQFARHLVHEGAEEARVSLGTAKGPVAVAGSYVVTNGALVGEPYLDVADRKFFAERCYLPQSMLGRLLDIYKNSKAGDSESALTQFVKDLLGLNQLDALVEGLHDAGHKSRTRNLVPEYRSFEARIERSTKELAALGEELRQLDKARGEAVAGLTAALVPLFPDEKPDTGDLQSIGVRLRGLGTDAALLEAVRRRNEVASVALSWTSLPKDADAAERKRVEGAEGVARTAADLWRKETGTELEEVIDGLRRFFPDLPAWSSTDPLSAHGAALRRTDAELGRLKTLFDRDAASEKREAELNEQIAKEDARSQLIDSQIAAIASNAGEFAGALARLVPHVHTDDCPVCGRNFSEVSKEPLAVHLQQTIARLTQDAAKLSALATEKSSSNTRVAQLRRELASVRTQRVPAEARSQNGKLQADLQEAKVALDRLAAGAGNGAQLLSQEALLKGRLATFRERDRAATDLRETIIRIASEIERPAPSSDAFEPMLSSLRSFVEAEVSRLETQQRLRNAALLSFQSIGQTKPRHQIVASEISSGEADLIVLKGAVSELETLKAQAKTIAETARDARTSIVRRVFNDSLNKLWRDLFVRLAPTEPFVPAFRVPETDSDDFATLETIHRSGKKAGTPGAMLSSGNLNTAALTLFLALHFSVGSRLPWLVLDDPVQNMDEVHVAQFAALLRTLSRDHGTKVIIAVHERPLFDYLRLELSPSYEKDRLLTIELRRTAGEDTSVVPSISTYEVDAVAA